MTTANGAPSSERYSGAAIVLHWLTAALLVVNLLLGVSMVPLPISPRKLQWYAWHKWIGITVFLITWLRLAWRHLRPAPAAVSMPPWQRRAAAVSHTLLYVLLLLVPISGWLYSSTTGVQVVYLGLVPLPDLLPKDRALAAQLKLVHVSLNVTLVAVVLVHAAAAIRHHLVDRDEVLARMLPGLKPRGSGR